MFKHIVFLNEVTNKEWHNASHGELPIEKNQYDCAISMDYYVAHERIVAHKAYHSWAVEKTFERILVKARKIPCGIPAYLCVKNFEFYQNRMSENLANRVLNRFFITTFDEFNDAYERYKEATQHRPIL
jgi:hypothetical protein